MKQTRTTLKELTAMYRAVLRHGILCNAIALGLIAGPIYAAAPDTTNNVFVLGDIVLTDQHVANGDAAFAGRRMSTGGYFVQDPDTNVWESATQETEGSVYRYQNMFPNYKMVARSLDMSDSDTYVGPVTLTLQNVTTEDGLAFNYQVADTDVNLVSVNPALHWNISEDDVVAAGIPQPTAWTIAQFAHLDDPESPTSHQAGSLAFNNTQAVVDGATVNADAISVTNGSSLTIVKQDTALLNTSNRFYTDTADIDSTGVTTLNADTINLDNSRLTVAADASLVLNPTTSATFQNNTYDGDGGAISNLGTITATNAEFINNVGVYGGAIENSGTLSLTDTTFAGNTASVGGAIDNYGGNVTLVGGLIGGATAESGNQALYGGGISNSGSLSITGTTFQNNVATAYYGGAITSSGDASALTGTVDITGASFYNNVAPDTYQAGAIMLRDSGDTTIKGSVFGGLDTSDAENPVSLGNSAGMGGAIYVTDTKNATHGETTLTITKDDLNNRTVFDHNTAVGEGTVGHGGALAHKGYKTLLDLSYTDFTNNTATNMAGALTITTEAGTQREDKLAATIDNVLFANNSASSQGGAVWIGAKVNMSNTEFRENSTTGEIEGGGALDLGAVAKVAIDNVTFTGNESSTDGGAIATRDYGSGDNHNATLDIVDSTFTGNTATTNGGAINNNFYHSTTDGHTDAVYVENSTFASNSAANGGAIYNNKGSGDDVKVNDEYQVGSMYLTDSTFTGNTATGKGGAVYNEGIMTLSNAIFGGAEGGNSAEKGGAIYNKGILTFDNITNFNDNVAGDKGGAIYNDTGATITFLDSAYMGDNIANGHGNSVYNLGTININAAAGKTLTMAFGNSGGGEDAIVDGDSGAKGNINLNGLGTVRFESGVIKNQNINVNSGEFALDGFANLTDESTHVNVAADATLNSQDSAINNYSSVITLADGAKVVADANASSMDMFGIASGDTVTLSGLKMLSDLETASEARDLATAGNVTIDPLLKVYTTANKYAVTGNTADSGKITIAKDGVGGLRAAVTGTVAGTQETVNYAVTGAVDDATVTTDVTIQKADFTLLGAGTEDGDTGVTLNQKLSVDEESSLSVENAKITGTGSIDNANEFGALQSIIDINVNNSGNATITQSAFAAGNTFTNAAGATTTLVDSEIHGTFRNFGIVHSDPTTIYGLYDNAGYTDFDEDTFDASAELHNTGTVDLKNDVTFASGATITGDGIINMLSGTTHFNNTASSNILQLAAGAKFDGTLASTGVLDTRNANIDTGLGTVTGGDLYVDANLATGAIDTFANATGATIKVIKLANTGYSTEDSISLNMGGAALDSNVEVEGMNYFTKVEDDGAGNLVFSDKLVNTSGMNTAIDNALVDTALTGNTTAENLAVSGDLTVGGNAVLTTASSLDGSKLADASVGYDALSTDVQSAIDKANSALQAGANISTLTNDAGYQTASDVSNAITSALGTSGAITGAINDKIDAAVGDRSSYTEHNIIANGESVATSLDKLDMAVADKQDAIIDNDFIIADGAGGLKVKNASVGTAQLDSTVNAALVKANSAVQSVSTGTANGTINVDGTEVSVAGWSTKQDVISDTTTIVKDGTGLKVANGSIGATQLAAAVNDSLALANSAVQSVAEGSANGTISVDGTDVAVHGLGSAAYADTNAFDAAGSATAAQNAAIAYTDAQLGLAKTETLANANAYTDRRIEDLDKNLSAGVAGAVALSSVAVSGVERGEVSVGAGYGYFNGQSAAAFGATMGLSNRWSINAGAGISNADVSFRAGTNYKFKLF